MSLEGEIDQLRRENAVLKRQISILQQKCRFFGLLDSAETHEMPACVPESGSSISLSEEDLQDVE